MTSSESLDLQAKVRRLEIQLSSARSDLNALLRKSGSAYWEINSLIARLQSDLLNPVTAIISNAELQPSVSSDLQRFALSKSTRLAALRLEDTLQKILVLASASTSGLKLKSIKRSLRSITHESILLSASLFPEDRRFACSASFDCSDVIVDTDAERFTHLIAAIVSTLVRRYRSDSVHLSLCVDVVDAFATTLWTITLPSNSVSSDLSDFFTLPSADQPMAGRTALDVLFITAMSASLGSTVSVSDDCSSVQVRCAFSVVRRLSEISDPNANFSGNSVPTIAVVDEPPASFTPLSMAITPKPTGCDLNEFLMEAGAQLLILHQLSDDQLAFSSNLRICRQVNVPVLLRASSITYDQYIRYRQKLDAILLEPSDSSTLLRYVYGLCASDKRHIRRDAEIH